MKLLVPVAIALLVMACGSAEDDGVVAEIDFCSCVNEPLDTNARVKACGDLMNSLTPAENASKAMACRENLPVPEGGPDLCFCLRTTSRDVDLMAACEAIIPDDMTPRQLTKTMADCAQ